MCEFLGSFFVSVFNSKSTFPLGTQPSELEDGDEEEQNEVPTVQEEEVSDLLLHLDVHKSMGPDLIGV